MPVMKVLGSVILSLQCIINLSVNENVSLVNKAYTQHIYFSKTDDNNYYHQFLKMCLHFRRTVLNCACKKFLISLAQFFPW